MTLPASGAVWPPRPHDQVLAACAERQVWWEGDPDKLATYYGGQAVGVLGRQGRVARAWRAFWSRPTPTESEPRRVHVPIASDLGRIAASTTFGEPPVLTSEGDQTVQDTADLLLNTPTAHAGLLVAAESAAMLHGTYGRIVWDRAAGDHAWIDWVDGDRAIPTFRWGRLVGVTFWSELPSDDERIVWRHLEEHTPGAIAHGLYRGVRDQLGTRVSLPEHAGTAALSDQVATGSRQLTACYIPHRRPNPAWRNIPELRPLGRPDLSRDVLHLLDRADETWSSWMRDLELGKARVFASEQLLNIRAPGQGAGLDLDRAVFSPIGVGVGANGEMTTLLEAQQFEIRVQEHAATFDALLRRIVSACGYSPLTFGLADEVATTATEVDAKERDTNATRSVRTLLWAPYAQLATTLLEVDHAIGGGGAVASDELIIGWPPTHQQSERQRAETADLLRRAEAASTETLVRMLHPEWDETQVDDEVTLINDARTLVTAVPGYESEGPGDEPGGDPIPPDLR